MLPQPWQGRSTGLKRSLNSCWWMVRAPGVRGEDGALVALLVRSVAGHPSELGEADAVGRRRRGAVGVPRCVAVPVTVMCSRVPVRVAGCLLLRETSCWSGRGVSSPLPSWRCCVPRTAPFPHSFNTFPRVVTEDGADGVRAGCSAVPSDAVTEGHRASKRNRFAV